MKKTQANLFAMPRHLRAIAVAITLLAAATGIGFLSFDVFRKIDEQSTASTDNVQWVISQINVEYLQLLITVNAVKAGEATLDDVRQRFDIFFSRMLTMDRSPVFRVLRQDPSFAASHDRAMAFLDAQIGLIDGSDAELIRNFQSFADAVQALRPDARTMGLTGIRIFARLTDVTREGIVRTLLQVSVLSLGLFAGMAVLAVTLARMNEAIKQQARANLEQTERVKAVFATSLDAIVVADFHGHILEFNAAAEAMFGYAASEVLGKPMGPFLVPEHLRQVHERGMAAYRKSGRNKIVGAGRVRLEARRKSGKTFPIELAVSISSKGDEAIFISFLRDLSAQVAAEEELYRARDNALAGEKAKAELLAVMSHEMRTPLNGMLGAMELLKDTRLTARQKQYHSIMESSGRLLLHHVNDVLDIARLDSGKASVVSQSVDIADLISDVVDGQTPVAQAGGNILRIALPEDGRTVIDGDPLRLRQILLNLIGNALKFTRDGEVLIEVERMDDAGEIEFRVFDTGIGIHEDDLDRIFDDFVTLDPSYSRATGGTGLGLGIVRRWVEAMGGEVGVTSDPGEGSLFWVRLPLPAPARHPAVTVDAVLDHVHDTTGPSRSLQILVVEDNPVNRLVVREMLERDGHSVTEAVDGSEGIRLAATRRWDVILMDVSMPKKDGVEATLAIRASEEGSFDTPIIALTAHALPTETERFHAAGMQEVMTKPISRIVLRQMLRRVTEGGADSPPQDVPTTQTASAPLADVIFLADLRDTLGETAFERTIKTYAEEAEAQIAAWTGLDLPSDMDAGQLDALRRDIHMLSGSSAMLGAVRLRSHLVAAETACKEGTVEEVEKALQQALGVWPETRSAMMATLVAS